MVFRAEECDAYAQKAIRLSDCFCDCVPVLCEMRFSAALLNAFVHLIICLECLRNWVHAFRHASFSAVETDASVHQVTRLLERFAFNV